jgi:hypothetical protein
MSRWSDYLAAGWKLVAIAPGTKGPKATGWNAAGFPFDSRAMGAGLRHADCGTCSIDIDHYEHAAAWLAEAGVTLSDLLGAEDSVQISSGREGRGKLLYRLDTPLPSFKLAPYKVPNPDDPAKPKTFHALEFRCAASNGLTVQDVLPPTIHPETGYPYTWVYGDAVLGHWSLLPALPAALAALWRAQIPVAPQAVTEPVAPIQARAEETELVAFLKSRDPDATYDGEGGWLETGAILHHETRGSPRGLLLWDTWSRLGKKYDGKAGYTPAEKWRTFRLDAENPATIGQFRREQVCAPEDFAVVPAGTTDPNSEFSNSEPDVGEDTRPGAQMQRLLEPRLVYLLNQGKYYFLPQEGKNRMESLDEHGECGLGERQMHMLFNPYMPVMQFPDSKGNMKRKKVKPNEFLEESRTKQVVGALGFHPGEGRVYSEDHVKYLNRYVHEQVEALRPKCHELEAWQFLIGRIKDDDFRRWLLKFYAFALRNPGVKIESAPLLYSKTPGNGKTTLMYTVPRLLFGSRYVREVSSDTVNARFTAVLADAWWIVLDELKTDGPKMDRVAVANKIKPWITAEKIGIEKKGLDVYEVRNRIQITASSNFEDPIHIENDDRRWGMSEMTGGTMTRAEKTDLFTGFLSTDRAAGVLKWIFEQESLVGFDPKAEPPDTMGKRKVAAANLGTWETKLAEAIAERTAPFDRDIVKLPEVQDFLTGSNVSQLRLGSILRRAPFNGHKQQDATGTFWIWRNVDEWRRATGSERFAHYETGARPGGRWDLDIPLAIRRATGDDSEPESLDDLLGVSHG